MAKTEKKPENQAKALLHPPSKVPSSLRRATPWRTSSIFIDDQPALTPMQIKSRARCLKSK